MDFSRAEAALIASSGIATSMSFLLPLWVMRIFLSCELSPSDGQNGASFSRLSSPLWTSDIRNVLFNINQIRE